MKKRTYLTTIILRDTTLTDDEIEILHSDLIAQLPVIDGFEIRTQELTAAVGQDVHQKFQTRRITAGSNPAPNRRGK